ncbi:hypothetical protein ABGV42_01075 [Paenibacillus pabuli]|uniref:hypothetical protein n=1 Tax=Paenibacillus pabuli TaxID=1472 RepID=UPI00324263CB
MKNDFDFKEQLYSCFHFDFIEKAIDNCIINGNFNNNYEIGDINQLVDFTSPFWKATHDALSAQPQYGDLNSQLIYYLNTKIFGDNVTQTDPQMYVKDSRVLLYTGYEPE